jgi:glucose-6-phosphate dehydrogenase assembly protein OpcA
VWWRGCSPDMLDDLARLADRVVLDDPNPLEIWPRALEFFERSAFSDLHWTRLTRWRMLMAHFFDIPEVQAAAARFDRLFIKGNDTVVASLYAAWLTDALGRPEDIRVEIAASTSGAALEEVRLSNGHESLTLRLAPSGTCVVTSTEVQQHRSAHRTVPLGDQSVGALLTEELRIRVRDRAFEAAVRTCMARQRPRI